MKSGSKKTVMPTNIKPMLATLIDKPFDSKDWIFETKWDGYRALAEVKKDDVHLYSRNLQSFDKIFGVLVDELRQIQMHALIDGEIVVLDDQNKPSFQLVQNYQKNQTGKIIYYVFDLLFLEGYDIRHLPLIKRKALLKKLLPKNSYFKFCKHVVQKGIEFFKEACEEGSEGIIAKKAQSTYQSGRSHDWLKIKTHYRQEAIICGFTPPKGSREKFGSLLLGVYDQGKLMFIGHTGSGFDHKKLVEIFNRLQPLIRKDSPFASPPKLRTTPTWVEPTVVCEVKFAEWTKEGQMRQAIFIDLRNDKKASEVIREKTNSVQKVLKNEEKLENKMTKPKKPTMMTRSLNAIRLTHLDKIYWPEEGYTKGDLIEYYQQVHSIILPYLKDRPESLHRFPNGIQEEGFYQKDAKHVPSWIKTITIQHEDRKIRYLIIDDERSLLYTVNLGCIDLNPFNSRVQSLQAPDYLIIDLDPEDASFEDVIIVAQEVHRLLKKWDIPSVCKTSGATGLHIYIPMGAQYAFEDVVQFAKLIAELIHQRLPDLTSIERNPAKRQKRVYLDYLQNRFGQTVVAPYSVRAVPGASVSTPLKWSEVRSGLDPSDFTIKTVLKRFKKVGDLFKLVLEKGINIRR